ARAGVEAQPKTVLARKLLYQAEHLRLAAQPDDLKALALYENPAALQGWREVMEQSPPDFKNDSTTQEDTFDAGLKYLRLYRKVHGANLTRDLALQTFLGQALAQPALARPVCMATAPPGIGLIRYGVPARALAGRFARQSIRCTQIPYGLATPRYVRRAHAAGLQVHVWTVNDPKIMAAMLDVGVDGIMTDQIEALRELMVSRGQWNPRAA
ncbi:MAG TPA: glycerophosphodiester phosphodiesterase family protein, partial [Streptosporangiaceae bacterium]|nr:glycerophosphodiester phosphodiesterase family protein [Streptosporangiaceae bacterium]